MTFTLHLGDCLGVLEFYPDNSIDSIVTDPPYGLSFMGKKWDYDVPSVEIWKECLRVLKPGGHLLSFSSARTYHRMVVNVEDAGFEIRDQLMWVYGSGFPKNHNVGDGKGTALKPAHEPIVMARKPISEKNIKANVLKWGTGAINIDKSRVPFEDTPNPATNPLYRHQNGYRKPTDNGHYEGVNTPFQNSLNPVNEAGRFPANFIHDGDQQVLDLFPDSDGSGGSTPQTKITGYGDKIGNGKADYLGGPRTKHNCGSGSAARFFYNAADDSASAPSFYYCAKASKKERTGNNHPTVKPIKLMSYLVGLVTPPGGVVLDPFMGSGTTGIAAVENGYQFVGVEMDKDYLEIATRRINNT